jgi:hypothetical protein
MTVMHAILEAGACSAGGGIDALLFFDAYLMKCIVVVSVEPIAFPDAGAVSHEDTHAMYSLIDGIDPRLLPRRRMSSSPSAAAAAALPMPPPLCCRCRCRCPCPCCCCRRCAATAAAASATAVASAATSARTHSYEFNRVSQICLSVSCLSESATFWGFLSSVLTDSQIPFFCLFVPRHGENFLRVSITLGGGGTSFKVFLRRN